MDNVIPVRLTLVSASPRRRDLLARLNIPFDIYPSHAAEVWHGDDGRLIAQQNARRKVEKSEYFKSSNRVLLGADTIISGRDFVFGKPAGCESAQRMLESLSAQMHSVITGICISGPALDSAQPEIIIQAAVESTVQFRPLSPADIQDYIRSGEWKGKAGAYAIQSKGRSLIKNFVGDFDNIVGLPVHLINDLLIQHFGYFRFL